MTRSLRLRFFLITWPIAVMAVSWMAWSFDRWTRVELREFEIRRGDVAAEPVIADSVALLWDEIARGRADDALQRLARHTRPPTGIIVLDSAGILLAATDSTLRAADADSAGTTRFERTTPDEAGLRVEQFWLRGHAVRSEAGTTLGHVYLAPGRGASPTASEASSLVDAARRILWRAVLVASALAAAAAILLAGPVVRQMGRLSEAAAALRAGALHTRVREGPPDELGRLERSFNAMAEALQRADVHKRNLVSDVAHELRTPLTNMTGLLEAVDDGFRDRDTALASFREEVALLTSLVDELQELSLAESGQLAFRIEVLDAVAEADAAVQAMTSHLDQVRASGPSASGPMPIRADRRRLAQVLRNLLQNALQHTPAGGRVSVEVERRGEMVAIVVTDTGAGIPAAHLPLIWERFHRVDPSRDRAKPGMGLGLAFARQLIEGMGGTVSAESREGSGSSFEVRLPAA